MDIVNRWRTLGVVLLGAGLIALVTLSPSSADGQKDNSTDNVRPVPPKGVAVAEADVKELKAGLDELQKAIDELKDQALVPDVEIYHKAVRYAVDHGEFFNIKEIPIGKTLLKQGLQRAKELKAGKPTWTTQTGRVVRGYRSKIDGSVQPYGLVVPKTFDPNGIEKHRLDFWWHGRGETLSEVAFIDQRQKSDGEFTPANAFVLHPYGRYCNANKFAGEVDTFECLEHAKKHYRVDENRVVARGFSMGGAACWQYATHFPTLWAAAAPGAGFSETPEFLNVFQNEKVEPTWYEKKLWHLYNASDYAQNLFNLPTVAYSGEIDKQKQAADVMAREMKKVGLELTHIIGPKTGHSYQADAKHEVIKRIDEIVAKGKDPMPKEIKFVTYTLRYNQSGWIKVDKLVKHWDRAEIDATQADGKFDIKTTGVTGLAVTAPMKSITIDGAGVEFIHPDGKLASVRFEKDAQGKWQQRIDAAIAGKRHGLQGPIDDAFFDSFINVKPTGTPLNEKTGAWVQAEMNHAVDQWRKQFRGDAIVKDDTAITDDDIKNSNLVLWGDSNSNAVLKKLFGKLPVKWLVTPAVRNGKTVYDSKLILGDKEYPGETHVPVLIFPNPLNPNRYVVLNSGFTFREYDQLNNARQVPKLPDYAIIDTTTPPNSRYPGKVVRAGFFGEKWEFQPNDGQ